MGTRALVHVFDGPTELLCIYRQYDGYPSGLGAELRRFCKKTRIVNGISGDGGHVANGAGCFAAQLVQALKDGPGGVYIYPVGSKDVWEEYTYDVRVPSVAAVDAAGRDVAMFAKVTTRRAKRAA